MSWSWFDIASLVTGSALRKPATRLYPFERREPHPHTRGHIELKVVDCSFCTICAHRCPTEAIVVEKEARTWAIDHTLCILCGNCVDDCREACIVLSTVPRPPMSRKDVLKIQNAYEPPPPIKNADGVQVEPPPKPRKPARKGARGKAAKAAEAVKTAQAAEAPRAGETD